MALEIKNISQAHIFDAGKHYGTPGISGAFQRLVRVPVTGADGSERTEVRTEKLPPMPSAKYVNAAGDVVRLTLTQASGQATVDGEYALRKRKWMEQFPVRRRELVKDENGNVTGSREIITSGIEYGKCPLTSDSGVRWMPDEIRAANHTPCDARDFGRGKKYGDHCGCPHIEMIIAYRHGKTSEYEALVAEEKKSLQVKQFEEDRARNRAILDRLADTGSATGGKGTDTDELLRQLAANPEIMARLAALAAGAQTAGGETAAPDAKPAKRSRKGDGE